MANIKTIKNYLSPILRDEYYTFINSLHTNTTYPEANLILTTTNKNKQSYLNYTIEVVTNSLTSQYNHYLTAATDILNKYSSKFKYFKNTAKNLKQCPITKLYYNTYTITLTKEEAINLYTLFKLLNK